ncbi:hypothetical protein DM860_006734 [Cuscuta australis]|uniref:Major facilitator superfamily (MFS) profile domain-containing protein n=1 Tax=Cuscuta australis TaxID=267555 RepID=A0A328D5H1_9ASTE|nr:hypothetical protein DM860_006734 [Cuscuta australis]
MKPETLTLVLVNLAGIMERADESLLPGVYREVGDALHASPTGLGSLTLFRSIVQSLCYPLAAYLSLRHNRAHVIAYGAFLWAAATFLVAFSSTFSQVAVSRALNGIGLAIVAPAIQSIVADSTDNDNRGLAFGWLQFTSNLGSVVGGSLALLMAPITFMGIPGWRLSFHLVGLISVIVGISVRLFASDPRFPDGSLKREAVGKSSVWSEVVDLVQEARTVVKIQSFQIIVAQGVTGSFPWSALSFTPMWLELTGFSHLQTAILTGMFVFGSSVGGIFGGRAGDLLSRCLPNHGRIILAQISSASAVPLAAILLLALPTDPSFFSMYASVLLVTGFFISWNSPATNNPIFAEIVPEEYRTSIYALDRSLESVLSSFAPPVVGLLAQRVYGYRPVPQDTKNIDADRNNASSLAKALFMAIGTPMMLCCFIYSFLYFTYPRDRDRSRMRALIKSETQLLDMDSSALRGQYSQVQQYETKECHLGAESSCGEDGPDAGDSDELDFIK